MKNSRAVRCLLLLICSVSIASSQGYLINTLPGNFPQPLTQATQTITDNPRSVAIVASGNVYFLANNIVYKINQDGTVTRVAGTLRHGTNPPNSSSPRAIQADLNRPSNLAVDFTGKVYIADPLDNVIYYVDWTGVISIFAGTGVAGFSGDGGAAKTAQLNQPTGVAADSKGNVYIADTNNQRIRKVDFRGNITTIAGNGTAGFSGDDGQALSAELNNPVALAADLVGNVYAADSGNNRVRKISSGGWISTVLAPSAGFTPDGVAVDSNFNLFVSSSSANSVVQVSPNGAVSLFAGSASPVYSGDQAPATNAGLLSPRGVAVDVAGNVYIADQGNGRVRQVTNGTIATIAGTGATSLTAGNSISYLNIGIAIDASMNIFTADYDNSVIRKIDANGLLSVVAGTGTPGFSGDGAQATSAQLNQPTGLSLDAQGNLFIGDAGNHRIRKVAPDGTISTVAGTGQSGYTGDGGLPLNAQIDFPVSLRADSNGVLYFADKNQNVVRKIASGIISTVAGTGIPGFLGDGGPAATAQLSQPSGVAIDKSGNVLIADAGNGRLRKISNGTISTLATAALDGVTVDSAGNAYITIPTSNVIEEVTPAGAVTTIAGTAGAIGFSGDGDQATKALLNFPTGISTNTSDHIYFADAHNFAVRELTPAGTNAVLFLEALGPGLFVDPDYLTFTVSNASGAGPTNSTVYVTPIAPAGLQFDEYQSGYVTCDPRQVCGYPQVLPGGMSFPGGSVDSNIFNNAPSQMKVSTRITGGGASPVVAEDFVDLGAYRAVLNPISPPNRSINVSVNPTLKWTTGLGIGNFAVCIATDSGQLTGSSYCPIFTNQNSYTAGPLAPGTTYYWRISDAGANSSPMTPLWSFTTAPFCSYAFTPPTASAPYTTGTQTLNLLTAFGCAWTATSNASWISIVSGTSGMGGGEIDYSVSRNPSTSPRIGTITVSGQTFTVTQAANTESEEQQPPEPIDVSPNDGEVYYVINQASGLQADSLSSYAPSGEIRNFTYPSQRWAFARAAGNSWQIKDLATRSCLTTQPSSAGKISLAACSPAVANRWQLTPSTNGYYSISSVATSQLLDINGLSSGALLVTTVPSATLRQTQLWLLRPAYFRGIDNALLEKQEALRVTQNTPWWKDSGQTEDVLGMFKDHGINLIRLRPTSAPPYVNPSAAGCSGNACYAETEPQDLDLAKRAKNLGMSVELTLLFDGGSSQSIPAAWASDSLQQAQADLYAYVKAEIGRYRVAGAMPDLVAIGNEVDTGFLGALGSPTGAQFGNFAALQKTAMQAVQDASADPAFGPPLPAPLTCIHITPAWDLTSFFTLANQNGIPYDAICQSYYPFYHGPLTDAQNAVANPNHKPVEQDVLTNAANTLGKPIFIIETGEHYEDGFSANDPWYPPSIANQRQFLLDLQSVLKGLPNQLALGAEYWDAAGVNILANGGPYYFNGGYPPDSIYIWNGLTLFNNADASGSSNQADPSYSQLLPAIDAIGNKLDPSLKYKLVVVPYDVALTLYPTAPLPFPLLFVGLNTATTQPQQQWTIQSNGDGFFRISITNPQNQVVVLDGSDPNTTIAAQPTGSLTQEWDIQSLGKGNFLIVNRASGFPISLLGSQLKFQITPTLEQ